ncbi:MAG: DUF2175 family protein [Thermoplasmataceae archaeon]
MAEFKCYSCSKPVVTGEKFTFTAKGAVHFDCFVADKRDEISEDKIPRLRILSSVLESELEHLLNLLNARTSGSEEYREEMRVKYKDIEKAAGETTSLITKL